MKGKSIAGKSVDEIQTALVECIGASIYLIPRNTNVSLREIKVQISIKDNGLSIPTERSSNPSSLPNPLGKVLGWD